MSDIPRYKPVANDKYGITDDVDGKLCEYRDYARLKAEVERLRKAGDAMEVSLQANFNGCPYEPIVIIEVIRRWRNATEGKNTK